MLFQSQHLNSKSIVHVFEHKDLLYQCLVLKSIANITRADLVEGVSGHTANQQLAYGCACLIPDFPLTYVRGYERRTWLKPLRKKLLENCFMAPPILII